jgi:hypothetical protein
MRSLALSLTLLAAIPLHAQSFTTTPCNGDEGNTHNNSFFGGRVALSERATEGGPCLASETWVPHPPQKCSTL